MLDSAVKTRAESAADNVPSSPTLKALVEKYPTADVTELAGEMLKGVLRGRMMVQGGIRGMSWNLRFGVGDDGTLSAAVGYFSTNAFKAFLKPSASPACT